MGIKNGLSLETCTAVLQMGSARSATTELALPKLLKGDQAGEPRSTSISPLTRRPAPGLSGE
jgi:hypothetical protein